MFKALLGLSTKGSLKTMTVVTSIASVVSLPLVMVAALLA
jgi:H+/gluconate symporter-like permease